MATKKKSETKMKPRGKNIGETLAPITDAGDNTKYLMVSIKLAELPDIDMKDGEQVKERIIEYFKIHAEADIKPTVAGLGLALNGMDRRRLWEIRTGAAKGGHTDYDLPTNTVDAIKKAYKMLENQWENYMNNGKINPVSGIFLAKNNFGYVDKVEHVVTPNTNNDSDFDAEDIKKRYLPDSTTIEADFKEIDS